MEKAIKQRLLGGLVLVAGAALFLPMLLDGSGAPLTVPPMPVPPSVPALEAVAPKLDQQVQTADQSVTAAHEGQTFEPAVAVVEEEVAADAAAGAAVVPAASAAPDAMAEKAAADSKRLAAEKAAQERAAQAKLAREKVEKARAEQLAAQKTQAAPAKVVAPTAPATAKPAVLPAAWVVQVASLGSKEKADALVQSLRKKSYRAVAHQQGGAWKVTIGPELRREVAESIKSRLAADPELKLNGWVQAYKP